ncbi:hypothetical protein D9M68_863620 [compost metagenome]
MAAAIRGRVHQQQDAVDQHRVLAHQALQAFERAVVVDGLQDLADHARVARDGLVAVGQQHVGIGPTQQAPCVGIVEQVAGEGAGLHAVVELRGRQALAALVQAGCGLGLQNVGGFLRAQLQQVAHIEPG